MKFEEAMLWMDECSQLGSVLGLENMEHLTEQMNHPEEELNIIHVAGTNGKGSVSSFVAEILMKHGYKVGRYISPAVFSYQEKFQINHRQIGKEKLASYLTEMREICEKMKEKGYPHPTSFEIETALAFLYFKRENCDFVILEVGMGGRLDATNIIKKPVVSVLTSISMDHMQILGDSLEKIAAEKCGIIKKNCGVVSALQDLEAEKVILQKAERMGVTPTFVDDDSIFLIKRNLNGQTFSYKGKEYRIGLLGSYQIENACLALETVAKLERSGLQQGIIRQPFTYKKICRGLLETKWPGRFEIIHRHPFFVVDGAHNVDGAKKLMESIDLYFTNKKIIYIMGMFRDKEYEKVIAITCPRADEIITITTLNYQRALPALPLAEEVQKVNPNVTTAGSVEEAVEMAYLFAGNDAVIVAFGSLSFLGKTIECVSKDQTVRCMTHGRQGKN